MTANLIAQYPQTGGGAGLPTATAAGQVPTATGPGTTYTAQTPNMTLISKQTLGAPAATVTFPSIPQTFNNLKLVVNAASSNAVIDNLALQFNGDTAAHYNTQFLSSIGLTNSGSQVLLGTTLLLGNLPGTNSTSGVACVVADIPNYAGTVFNKTVLSTGSSPNGTSMQLVVGATQWVSTAAITQIVLSCSANLVTGSIFELYGY